MNFEFEKPVLTQKAVDYLSIFGKGVISKDFIGYMVDLRPKFSALLLITLSGKFRPFPIEGGKNLPVRVYKKVYKHLQKIGFIEEGYYHPFPEFEEYSNMKLNPTNTIVIDDSIFKEHK